MKHLLAALLTLTTFQAQAYMNLLTTGELVAPGKVQAMGYLEGLFDDYDGVNVNARGTYGINDEFSADFEVGAGEFDVMLGGFVKWVPVPDIEGQPAIGVRAGLGYIDSDFGSQTSVVAMPFIGKAFPTDQGRFTPYGGLPLAFVSDDTDNDFATRLVIGTEWQSPLEEYKNLRVFAEFGFELSDSFSSITAAAAYNF